MNWEEVKQIENTIIRHRRHIHKHPELSFREYSTQQYIATTLATLNIKHETLCDTGIVATIGDVATHGNNCIAFRAELDALPINEETGLPFASVNEGVMHACGHDMHIAMLLGLAEILRDNLSKLRGCVKFIFQPGEELLPGGAVAMLQQGCLQNPAPRMIFATHLDPSIGTGAIAVAPKDAMAATCEIVITVKGTATHGSTPFLGSDPVTVAAAIVTFAQTFVARYNNPLQPAVLSICANNGGTANNAFPEETTMLGTLRTLNESNRNRLLDIFTSKVKLLCELYDTACDVNVGLGYPPVINDATAVNVLRDSVEDLENINFNLCAPKMWAEDFSYYAKAVPACFYFIGCNNGADSSLHSNKFAPDEAALSIGTMSMLSIVKKLLC